MTDERELPLDRPVLWCVAPRIESATRLSLQPWLIPTSSFMFKRVLTLAKPHWLLLLVSILASLVFVFFNSLSIWLTASFISNILTDFETLLNNQVELLSSSERTANETLKVWTNRLILGTTALGTLKRLCLSIFSIFVITIIISKYQPLIKLQKL